MSRLDFSYFQKYRMNSKPAAPWEKYYSAEDMVVEPEDISIYQFIRNRAEDHMGSVAIEYFGEEITYGELFQNIDTAARAFLANGVRKGDIVTILSANVPEALYCFYALNQIGAVANMLHPLLSENEIKNALNLYQSVMLVALDITYPRIKNIISETSVYKTLIISAKDSMPLYLRYGYELTRGRKEEKPRPGMDYMYWKGFFRSGERYRRKAQAPEITRDTPAAILQSGGTTGTPKGIVLSNGNFNAATIQALRALPDLCKDDIILGIMPIFHGFGLEVSINDAFAVGAKVVLIPQFNARKFDQLVKQHNPTVLVGVPTLFEAMKNHPGMEKSNLFNLKYVIAGGDSFNKKKVQYINAFLHDHGSRTFFTQGFGMTEAVAAVSFDRKDCSKEGTVGIPWPGTYVSICEPGTDHVLPYGEVGEICVFGPTVMLGYYDNEEETRDTLKVHSDGNVWLHSGDLGSMDEDGFITYRQRIKRMIVTSGYNVYPAQIEETLEKHPAVEEATVVGVPHPYKIEVGKAFIVLKEGNDPEAVKQELIDLCKKNLALYAIPREWEFRDSLPKTIVGKTDFRKLQEEELEKRRKEEVDKEADKTE